MALTNDGLDRIKNRYKAGMSYLNYNEEMASRGYDFVGDFNKMLEDPNFQAWVEGTEFGAHFAENFKKLEDISGMFRTEFNELFEKLGKYISKQEEINASGGK